MPHKIVEYQCSICQKRFKGENAFEKAETCEKSHKIPVSVDKGEYESSDQERNYPVDQESNYPLSVLVHFEDNTSARYYLQ